MADVSPRAWMRVAYVGGVVVVVEEGWVLKPVNIPLRDDIIGARGAKRLSQAVE